MKIILQEGNKKLSFEAVGYEFPFAAKEGDENWLLFEFIYSDETLSFRDEDPSLTTEELLFTQKKVEELLSGERKKVFFDYLEPYFHWEIEKKGAGFLVSARYVYETGAKWKEVCVSEEKYLEGVKEICAALESMLSRFPRR